MKIDDNGILINVKKFSENSSIVHFLTQNNGVYAGIIKDKPSTKTHYLLQIGNYCKITWQARLSEHLGSFCSEVITPVSVTIILNKEKILLLNSICSTLHHCLPERVSENKIFSTAQEFITTLPILNHIQALKLYVEFELMLLTELGFGLDLSRCAVTETTDNLIYVSPKTGKAVSENVGEEYKDKLLKRPNLDLATKEDIIKGLNLTGYFLYKHIFKLKNLDFPIHRKIIINSLIQKV